jgi:UvrD-like helicase C-terminal domain/AAA domain
VTDVRGSEIAAEQRHLDRVYARLAVIRDEAAKLREEGFALASTGTNAALIDRDALVHHAARRMRDLDAEWGGLVFGRLDLAPANGATAGEVRHIGRLGLRDATYEPLVIDWRAPAAAPFYQATPEAPAGVVRRRVIHSLGEKVVDVQDELLDVEAAPAGMAVIGDGALLASLTRARGTTMRDIVATIQREQDAAVRAPSSGVTEISGGPGTGKTAVALHRAAYLLYSDRRRFEGGGVLVVGPSPVFMAYIDRVLPSLGEQSADLRALGSLVDGVRADRHDPPAVAALKGSLRMTRFLRKLVRDAPAGAPTELRVLYAGEVVRLDATELARLRRLVHRSGKKPNQARIEADWALLESLWRHRPDDVDWRASKFIEDVGDRREFAEFFRAWWPVIDPAVAWSWLADPHRVRRYARGLFSAEETELLVGSWAAGGEPTVEDVPLIDELRMMLGPPPRNGRAVTDPYQVAPGVRELTTVAERQFAVRRRVGRGEHYTGYRHVVVDEAQDVSPMQWRMLGRRGRHASWTVVGDAAQSAWPDPDEAATARESAFGRRRRHRFHLTTNYRNSAEIFALAAAVVRAGVPDADLPAAVRSTGIEPEHRGAPDGLGPAVRVATADLLARVEGTVGVIGIDVDPDWLAGLDDAEGRAQPVGVLEAKGMEYDAVVVVDPERIVREAAGGVRTLYVALTRATQLLITVGATPWSPPLPG